MWDSNRVLGSGFRKGKRKSYVVFILCFYFIVLILFPSSCSYHSCNGGTIGYVHGWEWSDWVMTNSNNNNSTNTILRFPNWITSSSQYITSSTTSSSLTKDIHPLSIDDVSNLRVRDIRRRLILIHGYSLEDTNKILDKKELIYKLAYEEEKIRLLNESESKRIVIIQCIITGIITIIITICWPILMHVYEILNVNIVVFVDRKKYEIIRCYELKSYYGMIGIIIMSILDILKLWLTISMILSWFISSNNKYLFPTPSIPIRPIDMLMAGTNTNNKQQQQQQSNGSSSFGINIGPMIIRWIMSFIYTRVEKWTIHAMAYSHRIQRNQMKNNESDEEKKIRKEMKRQRKLEKQRQEQEKELYAYQLLQQKQKLMQQQHQQKYYDLQRKQLQQQQEEEDENRSTLSHHVVPHDDIDQWNDNDNNEVIENEQYDDDEMTRIRHLQNEEDTTHYDDHNTTLINHDINNNNTSESSWIIPPESDTHKEFLNQMDQYRSVLHDLD